MRYTWFTLLPLFVVLFSQSSNASNNPFKKDKIYRFGSDIAWYKKADLAVKSGQQRNRKNELFFHLSIGEKVLSLRLSKNDPEGDVLNSRNLQNLTIKDIQLDGQRLPVFQWCLDNQERPSRYLKQYAYVPNDVCRSVDGDVIIKLDKNTHRLLQKAKQLKFVLEPFSREETVIFDLQGYNDIWAQIKPPAPVKRVVKKMEKKIIKPRVNNIAPAVLPPKKPKICEAKAPEKFRAQVKSISYPCDSKVKKANAIKQIAASVELEKQKLAKLAEEERMRLAAQKMLDEEEKRRAEEWAMKQKERWVLRCRKHWAKGVSPCFCRKYISEAPAGVSDTCKK